MRLKTLTLAAAAAGLVAAPVALQAQAASRTVAPVAGEQEMGGGSETIIAVLAVAILAGFIAITADDDDGLEPISP